jgi:hypothetical protein
MESEEHRVYAYVCNTLKNNPHLLMWVLKGATDGVVIAVDQARLDQADWEVIASMAMNKRLMDGNELFLADKIDALKPRASLNWGWYVNKLREIVTKKQEKESK